MTQFLLVRAARRPTVEAFDVEGATGTAFFEDAALRIFRTTRDVWVVRPRGDEMDSVVNDAYSSLLDSAPFAPTRLSRLVQALLSAADAFAFFYGSDCDDLPSEEDILGVLEHELSDPHRTPEIYLRWEAPNK